MQLTELERKAEAKAYKDYKSFDDPMWKSKNQDWYMVRIVQFVQIHLLYLSSL